ncbi:hypothetical protein BH09MYX1_BH09MYX1_07170 [soil metagenome]
MAIEIADVLRILATHLRAKGYKRTRSKFTRVREEVINLVELQKLRVPDGGLAFFVNLGIMVPSIFHGMKLEHASYAECHWARRLATAEGREIRYEAASFETARALADDVFATLVEVGLPQLDARQTESSLIEEWQRGAASNLSDFSRTRLLNELLKRAGRTDELVPEVALGAWSPDK